MTGHRLSAERKAERLRLIAQCVRAGLNRPETAAKLGLSNGSVSDFLYLYVGSSALPRDPQVLEEAARAVLEGAAPPLTRHTGSVAEADRIAAMREKAAAEREAHERQWLEAERQKYGLPRRGRSLSEMPL